LKPGENILVRSKSTVKKAVNEDAADESDDGNTN
jgi:hypothetical protein